jgi:membrane protein implicated in regulation of membrane protease activity
MVSLIDELSGLELLFVICAAFGTILFVIRLVLMFIGGGGEEGAADADAGGMDGADGHDLGGHDLADSDLSFKALSLQGITAFFMMFGLVGWALVRQGNVPAALSILGGTIAGLATVWIMKKIFQAAGALQSSGTLDLQNAIGQEGLVYLTIHPGQIGKVQVVVQGRLSVLNAIAEDKTEEIKTGQRVWVVRVSADTLVVEKLES